MAIRLKKKSLRRQFQKISSQMIDEAVRSLAQRSAATRGRGVHNARKQFKKLRAVLRLIRDGLTDKTYDREDNSARKAGKPLSAVRDADVTIETLDRLLTHFEDQVSKGSFKTLRNKLVSRRRDLRKQILERQNAMGKVSVSARKLQKRVEAWPSLPDRFEILNQGIRDTYAEGRHSMRTVRKEATNENLHEWRKLVKYLRYQLEILESLWPPLISEMFEQAHLLTDALGMDHDLDALDKLAQGELKESLQDTEKELLIALINQRRAELKSDALTLGKRLYTETPKQFSERLKGYWKAWQNEPPLV